MVGPYEVALQRLDGSNLPCINSPTTICDASGAWVGRIALFTDISEIKEAQVAIESSRVRAEKANQAKSEFLSSMSHELRTPLNAILGFGQLLENDPDHPLTSSQVLAVQQILEGGQYLLSLIGDLLDLGKVEQGSFALSIQDVEVTSLVADCLVTMQPVAEKAGIRIESRIDNTSRIWVLADQTRSKQVLLNILSNAVKYNASGGNVTVSCLAFNDGIAANVPDGMVRITVTDTGPGIPESLRDRVFQPFDRLGYESGTVKGTGIGLSITKRLVTLMGGEINFESREGKGTSFWVDLPISTLNVGEESLIVTSFAEAFPVDTTFESATVLHVEDNPANIFLMEQIVRRLPNITLISTHTAELGLEMAQHRRPELIILDINLPGMNGVEALARLRQLNETREIPVIALSANSLPEQVRHGLEAGFLYYLTKPINVPELINAMNSAIATP